MKKQLFLVFIITILLITILLACENADKIISLVDDSQGYEPLEGNNTEYDNGKVKNIFINDNKYVFHIIAYNGYMGDVDVVILIENGVIKEIAGHNIKETKGYGTRAFENGYLDQFRDITIKNKDILIGKSKPDSQTDIIYVTGATRTSNAVLNAINVLILYYNEYNL